MGGDVEMSLNRAEHFELLAAKASSNVLRCRYLSMARYWSILSSEGLDGAGSSRDNGVVPSSLSLSKPAPLERVL
jgi:hypothetical protein